ncbi:tubulin binding cofactor C-domain-containing protein, partial [Gorgonomyces haynaldii]
MQRETQTNPSPPSETPKRRYTRKDLVWSNLSHTSIVKEPLFFDTLLPFEIQDSTHCEFYLMNPIAQCTIDQVHQSFVFLGPSEGPVFLRDCSDLTIVCASQQFRMKNCKNCHVVLHCATAPVIELSDNLLFSEYSYYYPHLISQFHVAGLSLFSNKLHELYDFNPGNHWQFVDLPVLKAPESQGVDLSRNIVKRVKDSVEEHEIVSYLQELELYHLLEQQDIGIIKSEVLRPPVAPYDTTKPFVILLKADKQLQI